MMPHDATENTSSTASTSLAIGPASSTRLHTSRPEVALAKGTEAKIASLRARNECGAATTNARYAIARSHGASKCALGIATVLVLRTLRIRDWAILDDVAVEFGDGLNVLTGETGAGKSILVDALGLVAGARSDRTRIRTGSERAVVEALFDIGPGSAAAAWLAERGFADGAAAEVVVRREVAASGGRIWLNGSPCTQALLGEIGPLLVELHGQNEFRALLAPERHLAILDRFAADEGLLDETLLAHAGVENGRRRVCQLVEAAARREQRAGALLDFVREVEALGLRPGEVGELERERRVLRHAGAVSRLLDELVDLTDDGEPAAAGLAAAAARRAHELAAFDGGVRDLAERLDAAAVELRDVGAAFRGYRERVDFRPDRVDFVESRHAALTRLLARHGADEAELLERRDAAARELEALERVGEELGDAERELVQAEGRYARAALRLRELRQSAARDLARAVERQLGDLALAKASFAVRFAEPAGETIDAPAGPLPLGPRGADRVEFQLAANPGEPLSPLHKVASGGELSRVILALHAAAETTDEGRRALVFDEVDAGIGGAVADAVGARLRGLADRNQVLCVTHLAQVAAYADRHFAVSKRVEGGRTRAEVAALDPERRVEELARMVGGREATSVSRRHAAELVQAARRTAAARGAPRAAAVRRPTADGGGS